MTAAPAEAAGERFVSGPEEKRRRWFRVAWGVLFSTAIVAVVALGHARNPQPAKRGLLWSVSLVLTVANLGNLFFLLRYLRRIPHHHLEPTPGGLCFVTGVECSELDLAQVAAMRLFKRCGRLQHIQLVLGNNQGIRLEGYRDLPRLAALLPGALPPDKLLC